MEVDAVEGGVGTRRDGLDQGAQGGEAGAGCVILGEVVIEERDDRVDLDAAGSGESVAATGTGLWATPAADSAGDLAACDRVVEAVAELHQPKSRPWGT